MLRADLADAEAERTRALRLVVGVLGHDRVERALANGGYIGSLLRAEAGSVPADGEHGPTLRRGTAVAVDEITCDYVTSWADFNTGITPRPATTCQARPSPSPLTGALDSTDERRVVAPLRRRRAARRRRTTPSAKSGAPPSRVRGSSTRRP